MSGMSIRTRELPVHAVAAKLASWIRPVADDASELPLLHRLAIIYLMLPVVIWLVGWFEWWLGIPAAIMLALAFWQAISGSWRVSPRLAAVAVLIVAACWVMLTAAGGVFDALPRGDWPFHRLTIFELGQRPWPTVFPEPLFATYAPDGAYSPPLLRYNLAYYISPALVAQWLGPAVLNWAVPIWTWLGVALVLLMFTRERRGWSIAIAVLIFIFFSGMDALRMGLLEGWDWIIPRIDWEGLPGIRLGSHNLERGGLHVRLLALSNMTTMVQSPQHFISAGLYTFLILQLRGHVRFLAVSGILLAAAPFWSPFVAVGLLPLFGVLLWKNGVRPFLRWPNLLLAAPLAGIIALYLTSGSTDFPRGWIWEQYEWSLLARWMPVFYLSEFLLLGIIVWVLRPDLRRDPFFIACMATLILLPLYEYGTYNDLFLRGAAPALLLLCYFCVETIVPRTNKNIYAGGGVYRLGVAGMAVLLCIGSVTAFAELARATNHDGVFRFEQANFVTLIDESVGEGIRRERIAYDVPNALWMLLDDDRFAYPQREKGELLFRSEFDAYLEDESLVLVKERCSRDDLADRFFLYTVPVDRARSSSAGQVLGVDYSGRYQSRIFEGTCVVNLPMQRYEVAGFQVGQWGGDDSTQAWTADYKFDVDIERAYQSLTSGDLISRSEFDIYLDENRLAFVKEPCAPADMEPRFFLHVYPVDEANLPRNRRVFGFQNLDFRFGEYGILYNQICAAVRYLPDHEVANIKTGQLANGRRIWTADVTLSDE